MTSSPNLLVLSILGALGLAWIVAGLLVAWLTKRRNSRCTATVTGRVTRHVFRGDGIMFPIVEFPVNGQLFEARKYFTMVKTLKKAGFRRNDAANTASEEPDGSLYIKRGRVVDYRVLAEKLWPIGSAMQVYFDPQNPKTNYVERPIDNRFMTWAFVGAGAFIGALGLVFYWVI